MVATQDFRLRTVVAQDFRPALVVGAITVQDRRWRHVTDMMMFPDFPHKQTMVAKHFEHMKPLKNGFHSPQPKIVPRIIMRNKKALEQVQICVGVPSHPIAHENRHASYILNTLLGGGMSSRLFQNIRERQGLAYAIYSDLSPYRDTGCLSVYAGTSRESAGKVVQSVVSEFGKLKAHPIPEEELRRSKDQLKGSLMLSLESSTARMSRRW